jgi:hypothetical protein
MEAVWSSETVVSTYKSTEHYNPEDQNRHDLNKYSNTAHENFGTDFRYEYIFATGKPEYILSTNWLEFYRCSPQKIDE